MLLATDESQNTIGHHIAISDGYLELEPVFLRCVDKLSSEAQRTLSMLQNVSRLTIDDLRLLRAENKRENQQSVTVLPEIAVSVSSEIPESPPQHKVCNRAHVRSAFKKHWLRDGMFRGPDREEEPCAPITSQMTEVVDLRRRNCMLTKLPPLTMHKASERAETDEGVMTGFGNT
ncbi:MAG: hypothetical protein P1U32_03235, partial [Legionellaceae bacterium]|nr:hypothetical protein [Legionellaceae bacterium]